MTRAVLFDFYGTLARAVAWGKPLEDVFAGHGLDLDRAAWTAAGEAIVFDGQDHMDHSSSREHYVAWEIERLRQQVAGCANGLADVEPLVAELYKELKTFTLEAYPEVPEVLGELRERSVTVAVCSNWDWDLDRALAQTGVDSLVDVAVTSAQAGVRKPHPRIYELTLERCGVEPSEAVFVGDTWVPDVEGPLAAGLRPVHLRREGDEREEPPPLLDGVRRVGDMRGILTLA